MERLLLILNNISMALISCLLYIEFFRTMLFTLYFTLILFSYVSISESNKKQSILNLFSMLSPNQQHQNTLKQKTFLEFQALILTIALGIPDASLTIIKAMNYVYIYAQSHKYKFIQSTPSASNIFATKYSAISFINWLLEWITLTKSEFKLNNLLQITDNHQIDDSADFITPNNNTIQIQHHTIIIKVVMIFVHIIHATIIAIAMATEIINISSITFKSFIVRSFYLFYYINYIYTCLIYKNMYNYIIQISNYSIMYIYIFFTIYYFVLH